MFGLVANNPKQTILIKNAPIDNVPQMLDDVVKFSEYEAYGRDDNEIDKSMSAANIYTLKRRAKVCGLINDGVKTQIQFEQQGADLAVTVESGRILASISDQYEMSECQSVNEETCRLLIQSAT